MSTKKNQSGLDIDQLRRAKYATVEQKLYALQASVEFAKEAQKSFKKRQNKKMDI